MTSRAYLLIGFLLALLSASLDSNAETIAATPSYDTAPTTSSYFGSKILHCNAWPTGTYYLTDPAARSAIEQLCAHITPGQSRRWNNTTYQILDFDNVTWRSVYSLFSNTTSCPSGYAKNAGNYCEKVTYSCPANEGWTLSGSSCTRPDCPYARNPDGTCAGQCDNKGGTDAASGYYASPPTLICKNGCVAKRYNDLGDLTTYTVIENGVPKQYSKYGYSYVPDVSNAANGVSCSVINQALENTPEPSKLADPANAPQSCGAGQTGRYVNGKYTCIDSQSGQPVAESGTLNPVKTETKTVTNPDGSTTTTETTTYSDGSKKIKETTTPPSGSTAPTNTVEKEFDKDGNPVYSGPAGSGSGAGTDAGKVGEGVKKGVEDYCAAHPNSPICKETPNSTAGGGTNCETPPTCTGDAIQCAILRQQWENRCRTDKIAKALGEGSARAEQLAQVGEEAMNGEPTDLEDFTDEVDVSGQISTEKFLSGAALDDLTVSLPQGKTLVIPFSQLNFYLQIFGYFMVAASMLGAARIVGVI